MTTDNAPLAGVAVNLGSAIALAPAADTYVNDGATANQNFGAAASLLAKMASAAGQNRHAYLKFDTSSIAGDVSSVRLRVNGKLNASGSVPVALYAVADTAWGETTMTWNTRPAAAATPLAAVTIANTAPRRGMNST